MHPLMSNPRELTDMQLSEKLNKIYSRMRFFQQTGNSDGYQQAYQIYLDLVEETRRRAEVAFRGDDGEDMMKDIIQIDKK